VCSSDLLYTLPLPERGHGFAHHRASGQCVALARRPGRYARAFDANSGDILQDFSAAPGRHFYGHGVFTPDGRYLLASENRIADGAGIIGIRDTSHGYELVGEMPSHGIGPHEIALLADGTTLVVANGGIRTDPEFGREKLNLDTMLPSLAYIELTSGKLLGTWQLPRDLHQLSLRHIAVAPGGGVAIAMQFEGARDRYVPLVAWHDGTGAIQLLRAPTNIERHMRQYCGSVCISADGRRFAISSPRGNLVTYWDVASTQFVGHTDLPDGSGIAPGTGGHAFMMTSGEGGIFAGDPARAEALPLNLVRQTDCRWDNHLLRLDGA